jgi:hypothetical protein
MFREIKLEEWLTIAAITLGPLLAFGVQHWRDRLREDLNRKRKVFHQLILTLKVPMAPAHVDAINSVPLEFYSHPDTVRAWRLYTSHLNNKSMLKNNSQGWGEKKFELLIDLVYEMARTLGYDHIDKATLRDNLYVPQGYEDTEEQFRQIRAALLQVLKGERPVPVTTVGPVQVEEPIKAVEELETPQFPALPSTTNRQ